MPNFYQLVCVIRENSVVEVRPEEIFFHNFASSQQLWIDMGFD